MPSSKPGAIMQRRDFVSAFTVGGAGLLMPGRLAARARSTSAPTKIISFIARNPAIPVADLQKQWRKAAGSRKIAELRGLILSEFLQDGGGPWPSAPCSGTFDATAQSWHDQAEHDPAGTLNTLLAADAARSCHFAVRERIIAPPPMSAGSIKRTLLLVRRPEITHSAFMDHWTGLHAKLARDMPGLKGCVFNLIDSSVHVGSAPSPARIDGIVEIWWSGPQGARVISPQSNRWAGDGDTFIDRERTRVLVSAEHVVIPPPR